MSLTNRILIDAPKVSHSVPLTKPKKSFVTELFDSIAKVLSAIFGIFNSSSLEEVKPLKGRTTSIADVSGLEPKKSALKVAGTLEKRKQVLSFTELKNTVKQEPFKSITTTHDKLSYIKGILGNKYEAFIAIYNTKMEQNPTQEINQLIVETLETMHAQVSGVEKNKPQTVQFFAETSGKFRKMIPKEIVAILDDILLDFRNKPYGKDDVRYQYIKGKMGSDTELFFQFLEYLNRKDVMKQYEDIETRYLATIVALHKYYVSDDK